jgi:hypothetical protein
MQCSSISQVNMTELDLPHDQAALLTAQGGVTETNKVPVSQLWRYATPLEKLINCLAIFAAIAAGIAQPALTIAFGGLTSAFTDYQRGTGSDPAQLRQTLLDSVDKNILIRAPPSLLSIEALTRPQSSASASACSSASTSTVAPLPSPANSSLDACERSTSPPSSARMSASSRPSAPARSRPG